MMAGVSAPFRHSLRVRYSECDLQGVVFNANYLTYMDEALTELWRAALPDGYAGMVARGVDLLVAEVGLRYRAPARFDDELDLEMAISRLGTTGMTSELRVLRDGELLAEGTLRHVFVSAGEGTKTPIPDEVRRALEPYAA
jgi:acyl-CoA thioester hydrolase